MGPVAVVAVVVAAVAEPVVEAVGLAEEALPLQVELPPQLGPALRDAALVLLLPRPKRQPLRAVARHPRAPRLLQPLDLLHTGPKVSSTMKFRMNS